MRRGVGRRRGPLVEVQGRLLVFAVRQVPERWPRQLAHEPLIGRPRRATGMGERGQDTQRPSRALEASPSQSLGHQGSGADGVVELLAGQTLMAGPALGVRATAAAG